MYVSKAQPFRCANRQAANGLREDKNSRPRQDSPVGSFNGRAVVVGVSSNFHRVATRGLVACLAVLGGAVAYATARDPQCGLRTAACVAAGVTLPPLLAVGRDAIRHWFEKKPLQQEASSNRESKGSPATHLQLPSTQPAKAIAFEDGAAYERMTGTWSRLVGEEFLKWLDPAPGRRWLDVGCGNGAFTQLIVNHCDPASVDAFDPSPAQIDYALQRKAASVARFALGDAMAAPYENARFDVAVMALVLFYLPDPDKAMAEVVRTLVPGGIACAYTWDLMHGGSPLAPLGTAMREVGVDTLLPPSADISREEATRQLWIRAGLHHVRTCKLTVQRHFESFEELWETYQLAPSVSGQLHKLSPQQLEQVKARFRENLQQDSNGRITCTAQAVAVRGERP